MPRYVLSVKFIAVAPSKFPSGKEGLISRSGLVNQLRVFVTFQTFLEYCKKFEPDFWDALNLHVYMATYIIL